ncbi:MAG: NAD(+) kinase [Chromatiales bacterium]|jgi:NAD+ kinase
MSKPSFNKIGIVGKDGDKALSTLRILIDYVQQRQLDILLEQNTAQNLQIDAFNTYPTEQLCQHADLLVVVGGDGTLLGTARLAAAQDTPIVGINLGRLGFLVDISPDAMLASLDEILAGNFIEDHRTLLEVQCEKSTAPLVALNDVVVHKWNTARLIEFETFIDGRFVDRQRSDGLIISTPTGSTAYALSGGGPLIHPGLDAFALVPICPHTLSNRPIVVSSQSNIEIRICGHTPPEQVRVTCDGQDILPVEQQQSIHIHRHKHAARLIHLPDHDHYHILRTKLGWGKHHGS